MTINKTEKFKLRKSKKYKNLVSVGLGVATVVALGVAVDNQAKASEDTTPPVVAKTENPATNNKEAQEKPTKEQTTSLANENKVTGTVDVNLDSTKLDKAVENAKQEGLNTKQKEIKDLGITKSTDETTKKQEEVQKDYTKQAEGVAKKTEEYKKEKAETKAKQEQIKSENKAEEERFEKETKKYNEDKARIEKENADKKAKYQQEVKTYEEAKKQYETKVAELKQQDKVAKEEYDKALAEYLKNLEDLKDKNSMIEANNEVIRKRNEAKQKEYDVAYKNYLKEKEDIEKQVKELEVKYPVLAENGGLKLIGKYNENNRGSLDYYKNLTLINDKDVTKSEILTDYLGWHENTKIVPEKFNGELQLWPGYNNYWRVTGFKLGDSWLIKNVSKTEKGNVHLRLVVEEFRDNKGNLITDTSRRYFLGITNNNDQLAFSYYGAPSKLKYRFDFIDDNNKPLNLSVLNMVTDVDWSQGSRFTMNGGSEIKVIPSESGLNTSSDGVVYSKWSMQLEGEKSIPKGSFLYAGVGTSMIYTHFSYNPNDPEGVREYTNASNANRDWWENGNGNWGVVFQLFGNVGEVKKIDISVKPSKPALEKETPVIPNTLTPPKEPTPSVLPEKPTAPAPEKPDTPLPPKPEQPTPKPIPTEVTAPTVGYTSFRLAERPRVFKEARNLDNISLDNSLVSKNSTVKFTLKVDKLPAGREALNVLEFTDHLPQGYVIDEATVTRENNALGYNTAYDKANHTVVFSANSTLLNKLNANLNEVVDVVAPTVTGTVTNDGGIYKNNFKINLNNKYTTHSNVVTVNTPNGITPNKVNTNADNSNIDGKIVVAETTNYYKLLWDLDQYRGMKLSRNDIAKGFYYLEDYPEEAVTINNRLVSLVDSNGQAVTGVEVNSYDNLENAPENVKTMLSKANITPKGAFQLFTATNPTDFYNKYVLTGNSIKITNPMVVKDSLTQTGGVYENKAYQIDLGNGYATETVRNIVPKVDTNKHNYNEDGVLIDGKQVVAGTTNHYKLLWDLDQYRGMSATNSEIARGFFFVEDYPEEALTIDNSKVTMVDSKGQAVTGVEVSSYNSLENAPEDVKKLLGDIKLAPKGAFQLFKATNAKDFFNKYVLTGNSITITTPMKVKEELTTTGGTYNNKAYQVDFGKTFETNIVTNIVPKVTPEKHNTNEDGVVVDGKQVVAGTTNHYKLTWDLDQYRDMTATSREVARGFFVVEDYPEEALTIDNSKVTMVDSKGQAVTGVEVLSYDSVENAPDDIKKSLTNAKITPKGAFQLFRATNARDFFNKYVLTGNSITITTPMTVKEELTTTGGVFNNKMYQVDFGKGREVEHEVTNNIPKVEPTKYNTNEDGVVVDGKVIAPETVNNYKLLWDLDQYKGVVATSRELAKGFYFVEDYPEKALSINNSKVTMVDSKGQAVTGVEVLSYDSVENAPDDIKKALVNAKITPKGAFQVYKATNSREFYDKYVFTGNSITITSPMTMLDSVNKNGAVYNNKAYQIDFGKGRETDVVTNTVPKSNPEKHNYNEDGVLIDGGLVPVGSTTEYKLTWKLSNLRDVVGTNEAINRGFYYIDDYPEVLKTLDDRIKVLDSNGNVVNGIRVTKYDNLEQVSSEIKAILSKNNITPKGAFQVFSAENPTEFYNNYVKKGIDLTIVNPMQVTQALKENGGSYQNVAYEIDFGVAQVTDTITNTVPKVKPVKHNYNEDNVKIDGKVVLAASRTNYKLNWNLSAYKNVEASDKYIKKGFYFVDDYPEEALSLDEKNITITDDKGKAVVGVEVVNYESLEKAPEEVKTVLKEAKITPKGAFQLFKATDSKQFYNDYVKTGTNLTITNPMTVKPELARKDSKKVVDNNSKETENKTIKDVTKVNNSVTTTKIKPEVDKAINEAVERENNTLNTISKVSTGNTEKEKGKDTKGTEKTTEYKNRGYQIDFGNGYETDVVANNVPKIDPIKDVVIDVRGKESLQGKEIKLNKLFNYKLIGTEIPSNRGTKLTQYGFSDDYDEKADKYQANYRVFSMKDIKLTDGSIIKQDSELTKYTTQIMKDGKVDIEFDKEFLDKVDLDSEFQAEVYLQMERIASGEVKNTFIHTVNGVEETSNTVTTFTKEPEKPVKPEEPKQSVPPKVEEKIPNKSTGKVLPNTGVADNDGTSTAIALTALATAGFIARRKKVKNS